MASPTRVTSSPGAIHVYGGDFINQPRSQWGPGPLEERPYDTDEALRSTRLPSRSTSSRTWLPGGWSET